MGGGCRGDMVSWVGRKTVKVWLWIVCPWKPLLHLHTYKQKHWNLCMQEKKKYSNWSTEGTFAIEPMEGGFNQSLIKNIFTYMTTNWFIHQKICRNGVFIDDCFALLFSRKMFWTFWCMLKHHLICQTTSSFSSQQFSELHICQSNRCLIVAGEMNADWLEVNINCLTLPNW